MPDLLHSLQYHDLGHLHIVAELWGMELRARDAEQAAKELAAWLLDPRRVAELTASLPAPALSALRALALQGGRMLWATFARRFGDVRQMGPARRDREKPHLHPASASEILYYRALLARAFFDTPAGPQEFAYIPEDLLPLLQTSPASALPPLFGRAATPAEHAHPIPADDRILDEITSALAMLRTGEARALPPKLLALLHAAGFLSADALQAETVKSFLESPRPSALAWLIQAWKASEMFNELRLIPSLAFEGGWENRPRAARAFLLRALEALPPGQWWSLQAFIDDIKQKHPDFQRPAGDYDSWFIRRKADGAYLRGFATWDEVDGALIRFFIVDILHWLALADLAAPQADKGITAFRLVSPETRTTPNEEAKVHLSARGQIRVPRMTPRLVRYQIARCCEREEEGPQEYKYRLTPASLQRARQQGIQVEHLLTLLAKHSQAGVPPSLVKALHRWEAYGSEARVEKRTLLRVSRPEVLEELRRSRASRFLGERLSPTVVIVKEGARSKVIEALIELGLLAEERKDGE